MDESAEDRAARRWENPEPGAPKVCMECALSSSTLCRWHRGETPWLPEPPMIDPADAVSMRRAMNGRYRSRNRRAWMWAAVILAVCFVLVLLGAG